MRRFVSIPQVASTQCNRHLLSRMIQGYIMKEMCCRDWCCQGVTNLHQQSPFVPSS